MGKVENNKLNKQRSLLNSAFELFTTKGVSKTSIAEISSKAGMAKGTFYLYFRDKFDIRNRLISHESSLLFMAFFLSFSYIAFFIPIIKENTFFMHINEI